MQILSYDVDLLCSSRVEKTLEVAWGWFTPIFIYMNPRMFVLCTDRLVRGMKKNLKRYPNSLAFLWLTFIPAAPLQYLRAVRRPASCMQELGEFAQYAGVVVCDPAPI
jgi:hypothetical protein